MSYRYFYTFFHNPPAIARTAIEMKVAKQQHTRAARLVSDMEAMEWRSIKRQYGAYVGAGSRVRQYGNLLYD